MGLFSRFKIKRAKPHDLPHLMEIFKDAGNPLTKEEVGEMIENDEIRVLKKKKRIHAAFSFIVYGIEGLFAWMLIRKLAVAHSERGKGMGSFFMNKIKEFSKKNNVNGFFLFSLEKAQKFYEKHKLWRLGRFFFWRNRNSIQ